MTPQELQALVSELRSEPTCSVETTARAMGLGRTLTWETVRETGEICGIRAIRGGRRVRIPIKPLLAVLGYVAEPAADSEVTP